MESPRSVILDIIKKYDKNRYIPAKLLNKTQINCRFLLNAHESAIFKAFSHCFHPFSPYCYHYMRVGPLFMLNAQALGKTTHFCVACPLLPVVPIGRIRFFLHKISPAVKRYPLVL
ncbi:hypothetical protein FPZ49_08955 [Paenibacillus cremeus]|uniref:Uncharacterized protein n=1 Tax=Paenibacillus cremeus TaxID=2163881 RepID=A0A559KDL1_9BACL|nr:hypothetical protein FPZ49_08955 [Paenibacillus cremeus]